jgi:hypothetical protein
MPNIDIDLLEALPPMLKKLLRNFAKQPTKRNACYTVGYITALRDFDTLPRENYTYLLALINKVEVDAPLARELFIILEE